jgi:hypothetical protein
LSKGHSIIIALYEVPVLKDLLMVAYIILPHYILCYSRRSSFYTLNNSVRSAQMLIMLAIIKGRSVIIVLHEVSVLEDLLLAYTILPYYISRYRWDVGSIRSVCFCMIGLIALIVSMLVLLLLLYAYYSANIALYSRHIVLPLLGSQLSCVYAIRRI